MNPISNRVVVIETKSGTEGSDGWQSIRSCLLTQEIQMKPKAQPSVVRNYVMALIAKNDPTRYHTRSVEAEHRKLQHNRARRRAKERKEICEGSLMVKPAIVAREMRVRFSPCTPGVLPTPRTLQTEQTYIHQIIRFCLCQIKQNAEKYFTIIKNILLTKIT